MTRILIALWLILWPALTLAQDAVPPAEGIAADAAQLSDEDDKGFITRFLERNLSGAGRQVTIDGFRGALSSRATFDRLTIADEEGVWITLRDGAIQWNRAALFQRRIDIQELSAAEILLPRLPGGKGAGPRAEVPDFQLPTLPVAVAIEKIAAGRVELGQPVIGEAAVVSLEGAMNLAGGEGAAHLAINRVDGKRGVFAVDAAYSNTTTNLKLDLTLDEDAGGLFANLVGLHGRPSVKAEIHGEGPLKDFVADIRLATDGQDRVTGRASARAQAGADGAPGTAFRLEIAGDVASLLPPANRPFFGARSQLVAEGWRGESGRMALPVLRVETEALNLNGSLTTTDQGAPQSLSVQLLLGQDAGAATLPVRLPLGGTPTEVRSGNLQISYDAAQGEGWTLKGRIGDLARDGTRIGALTLDGGGSVRLEGGNLQEVLGRVSFAAEGLQLADAGMQAALGDAVQGESGFDLTPGNALELTGLTLRGADYSLRGDLRADGLRSGITLSGELDAAYQDLSRLSQLAGRKLGGRASARVSGLYTVLTRGFDAEAEITATDASVDQPQLDRLLAGEAGVTVSARRDETGITIRDLTVNAQRLTAQAQGLIASDATDLRADLRLSSLTDADPAMAGSLTAQAAVTGPPGSRRATLTGEARDLALGIPELDAALKGATSLDVALREQDGGFTIDTLRLDNPQLTATGQGSLVPGALDATLDVAVPDLGVLRPGFSGAVEARAHVTDADGARRIEAAGTGQELRLGQSDVDGALTGTTDFRLSAEQKDAAVTIHELDLTNRQMTATAQGVFGEGVTDLTAHADIRSLAAFGRGWRGALALDGRLTDDGTGARRLAVDGTATDLSLGQAQADAALAGATHLTLRGVERGGVLTIEDATIANPRLNAAAQGALGGGRTDLTARLNAASLAFLGHGIGGAVEATARLTDQGGSRHVSAQGTATGLRVGSPRFDALLAGQTSFDLAAAQAAGGAISIERLDARNGQLRINANGDPRRGLSLDASLADLALLVPGLPGPAGIAGTIRQGNGTYAVDLEATAPGGTRARIAGTAADDFSTTDLRIAGVSDAALVNPLLRVRSVEGPVDFDLRLNGRPALENLTGRISLPDAQLSDPRLGLRVENLNATADLSGGLIRIDASGRVADGGGLAVTGPVDLRNGMALDLRVALDGVVLRDPNLYETVASGELTVTGTSAEGPLIAGTINLGATEFRIPSTGLGGAQAIPDIVHLRDRPPVRATRAKAGLLPFPSADSRIAGMAGPPATPPQVAARLDVTLNAPNQVFVRGRGVDAELGGQIRLTGTARNVVPIGRLELIRGRVDLLGKRFDMTEGLVELQGSLIPVIRLVAQTEQNGITTRIIIDGELRDPEIRFESSPDLPQEEVLSHLLFGRGLDRISALQAAQLANAVAVLAGRGGEGIVASLRNSFGLDDLDLTTDDNGNVSVRAGKYLSRNLYTDLSVDAQGKSRINLNLDIGKEVTARGSVASDGESTIGVFYERDY